MDKLTTAYATDVLFEHLSQLRTHFEDPDVQEIEINTGSDVWVEKNGRTFHDQSIKMDDLAISSVIGILSNINQKPHASILDCRLPGLRIAAAQSPIAIRGPAMCIRKHARTKMRLQQYHDRKLFDVLPQHTARELSYQQSRPSDAEIRGGGEALLRFLIWCVVTKRNVIVTGATSSGKTTLLNAILAEILEGERLVTIEDTAELLIQLSNYVGFEANNKDVFIRDLVRLALRFAPKRIIVGEIRGAEAYDLMGALNTGHQGGWVTYHANASFEALPRLEGMIRQSEEGKSWPLDDIRAQIANTFHYIIHAAHDYGVRAPMEVRELLGAKGGTYQTRLLFSKVMKEDHFYA